MPHEIFFKFEDSDYGEGILLNEYNEVYSLIVAQEPKDINGTVYMRWCYPQGKDREPINKSIPMGVKLGGHRQAVKALRYFLEQLGENPDDGQPF